METRKHLAAEKKRQNTHNCAQSVVCTYCDLVGLDWIRVTRDRSPTREGSKQDDTTWNLFFDAEKIRGRRIVLVDDITTRGMSFVQCARKLMDFGAVEVVGFFFGKSVR
jgi:predicted amidophosphoribosyltransferase